MDRFISGEDIIVAGTLFVDNVQTSDYEMHCKLISDSGVVVKDAVFDIVDGKYSCILNTTGIFGKFKIRIYITSNGSVIYSNEDYKLIIWK